jgi:hypothetical protein
MFVRLTRTGCRPCAMSEASVRAALHAVAGGEGGEEEAMEDDDEEEEEDRMVDRLTPQLRVFWLNADDPGSSDAMAFFTSRRLCRGVPAHFLWRGSQDLHMPDLALDGAEPVALARLLARAGADGGPADLGEPGAMEAKNAGADVARLRREGDRGSLAVLAAMDAVLSAPIAPQQHAAPYLPPPQQQQPHQQRATPYLPPQQQQPHQQRATPYLPPQQQQPQRSTPYLPPQQQQPTYYYYPQSVPPPPIQRQQTQRPGAMHFTW